MNFNPKLFNLKILSILLFCLSQILVNAYCYEGFSKNPGTRAMAMAGVFSAQADDSSSIWYNPGSLTYYDYILSDITLEFGQRTVADYDVASTSDNIYHNTSNDSVLTYFGAYMRKVPFINTSNTLGIGISYYSPYKLLIDVNAPRSKSDNSTYGYIDAKYHQLSTLISNQLNSNLSVGGTVDFIWTDIQCIEFDPCTDYGPVAWGVSLGSLYEVFSNKAASLKLSGTWHSAAKTRYQTTPISGIGTVINDFLPDRPNLFGMGASLQTSTQWSLINTNIIYETIDWASAIKDGKHVSRYHNVGLAFEFLSKIKSSNTLALRSGAKLMHAANNNASDVLVAAIGFGYEYQKTQIIDFAYEYRRFNGIEENTSNITLSYAWQISR